MAITKSTVIEALQIIIENLEEKEAQAKAPTTKAKPVAAKAEPAKATGGYTKAKLEEMDSKPLQEIARKEFGAPAAKVRSKAAAIKWIMDNQKSGAKPAEKAKTAAEDERANEPEKYRNMKSSEIYKMLIAGGVKIAKQLDRAEYIKAAIDFDASNEAFNIKTVKEIPSYEECEELKASDLYKLVKKFVDKTVEPRQDVAVYLDMLHPAEDDDDFNDDDDFDDEDDDDNDDWDI